MQTLPIRIRFVRRALALILAASSISADVWVAAADDEWTVAPMGSASRSVFDVARDVHPAADSNGGDGDSRGEARPAACVRLMAIVCREVRFESTLDVAAAQRLPRLKSASSRRALAYTSPPPLWAPPLEVLFCTWQL